MNEEKNERQNLQSFCSFAITSLNIYNEHIKHRQNLKLNVDSQNISDRINIEVER